MAAESPTRVEPLEDLPPQTILGLPIPHPRGLPPPRQRRRNLEGTELMARYEVQGVIGEGGMATVYRGFHKTIRKAVAIKVLDGGLEALPDAVERFLLEAQVTSRVVHENVVEVTDFGTTADGVVFCVMELLQGETLAKLIDDTGAVPLVRAAGIMRQICSALQAAHRRGIIHRDLKPANCFRAPRASNYDFIKLLDFGIARVADGEPYDSSMARPKRTQAGWIIGTPDYMAPEQARAEPVDHRIDIYAAGGLFFELLTGRLPYLGNSVAEMLSAHMHDPVPDPGALQPTLSPAVRAIVRTAMAKSPDDRYPSMASMAVAIAESLGQQQRYMAAPRARLRRTAIVAAAAVLALGGWALQDDAPTTHAAAVAPIPVAVLGAEPEPAVEVPPDERSEPEPAVLATPPAIDPVVMVAAQPLPPPALAMPDEPPAPAKRARRGPPRTRPDGAAASDALPSVEAEPLSAKLSEVKNPFAPTPEPSPDSDSD